MLIPAPVGRPDASPLCVFLLSFVAVSLALTRPAGAQAIVEPDPIPTVTFSARHTSLDLELPTLTTRDSGCTLDVVERDSTSRRFVWFIEPIPAGKPRRVGETQAALVVQLEFSRTAPLTIDTFERALGRVRTTLQEHAGEPPLWRRYFAVRRTSMTRTEDALQLHIEADSLLRVMRNAHMASLMGCTRASQMWMRTVPVMDASEDGTGER